MADPISPNELPQIDHISQGSGSITQSGAAMQVQQHSKTMVADWQSFNVGKDAAVEFKQPDSNSIALNRVISQNPSDIAGRLNANGQVYLVNPNGVIFSKTAKVDVQGIIATTHQFSDVDFTKTNIIRTNASNKQGTVINQGEIKAHGGLVALVAPKVENQGHIENTGGQVVMAAGEDVTMDLNGDGLINVKVDRAAFDAIAANHGVIQADGGQVVMTAKSANAVMDQVVNNSGLIEAKALSQQHGRIILDGNDTGTVEETGTLEVSSDRSTGGAIQISGQHIHIGDGAKLAADGQTGGGTVLVGGSWKNEDPSLPTAQGVLVDKTAALSADAKSNGNGGTIVVYSGGQQGNAITEVNGKLSAKAGTTGNGGHVETSSHNKLVIGENAQVDASAKQGESGEWLLDPQDLTIDAAGATAITNTLKTGTSVTATTSACNTSYGTCTGSSGDIILSSSITKDAGGAATLSLNADNNIILDAGISSTSSALTINLNATGNVSGNSSGNINSNGGSVTINAGSGTGTLAGVISGSGSLTKSGSGTQTLTGNNTYTGTTTVAAGSLTLNPSTSNTIGAINVTGGSAGATLNVAGGTSTLSGSLIVGANSIDTAAVVTIAGNITAPTIFVGNANGAVGTVTQTAGTVTASANSQDPNFGIGQASGSTGVYNLSGGTVNAGKTNSSSWNVGAYGNGTFNQSGGTVNSYDWTIIGRHIGSTGVYNLSGGTLNQNNAAKKTYVGEEGTGTLTISGTGTLNSVGGVGISGGAGPTGIGTINLASGGTVITPTVVKNNGSNATFNFNGGTLQATGNNSSFMQGLTTTKVKSGGAIINDAGFAISIAQNLLADTPSGGLSKTGSGTVTLSGANTYTGTTTVSTGTLKAGSTSAFGTNSATTVASSAFLDLAGFANSIGSLAGAGKVTNSSATSSILSTGGDNTSTTFSGILQNGSGSLALTKTGTGTLTLTGLNTNSGTNTVSAGKLAVGANTLSRLGTGNINVDTGAHLLFDSTGYQSGTTIGGNLSGAGTVEIAGSQSTSQIRFTGDNSSFSGLFQLNAGARANLQSASAGSPLADFLINGLLATNFNGATFHFGSLAGSGRVQQGGGTSNNTVEVGENGHPTVFSGILGNISDSISLRKLGASTLTLTGNNTYVGATTIDAGTLQVGGTGSLPTNYNGSITIANGAGLLYSSSASQTLSGIISGAGGITVSAGILNLSGNNTYTGSTVLNAGTLNINGSWNVGSGNTATVSTAAGATLNGSGNLTADTLAISGLGTINLTGANLIHSLSSSGSIGTLTLNNNQSLSVGSLHASGPIKLIAGGASSDLNLANGASIESSATGTAIVLSAGRNFINQAGSGALSSSNGRWLIYSATPDNDNFGNLDSSNTPIWHATYAGTGGVISQTGDRYVFANQPSLTVSPVSFSKYYGDNSLTTVAASYSVTGYHLAQGGAFLGDSASNAWTGTPSVTSTGAIASANVGAYTITAGMGTLTATNGYAFGLAAPATLTVNQAPLTLTYTANTSTSQYGLTTLSALSGAVSGSGFVNGEGLADLVGSALWATMATNASPAGSYALTGSGLSSSNYNITANQALTNNSAYTISPALLTITANDANKTYDGTSWSGGNGVTYSGFVNGDNPAVLSGNLIYGGSAQTAHNAGAYDLTASGLYGNNYAISWLPGMLTINKALLTITGNSSSHNYNGLTQTNGFSSNMLYGNDHVANVTGLATGVTVGSYADNLSGSNGSGLANYDISYVNGLMTINKVPLFVTYIAQPVQSTDATKLVPLSGKVSATGFVNGENLNNLNGEVSWTTNSSKGAKFGNYAIIGLGLYDENYDVIAIQYPGNARAYTVKADSFSISPDIIATLNALICDDSDPNFGRYNPRCAK